MQGLESKHPNRSCACKGRFGTPANKLTSRAGCSTQQAQVLFLHTTYHGWKNERREPPGEFPQAMQQMQRDLGTVLWQCLRLYPNLKIAYLTCDGFRHFTVFEPHVWQESFALKWLIASQIAGTPRCPFKARTTACRG